MKLLHEDNPFEDQLVAHEWIHSVEGEKDGLRDREIYPLLKKWCANVSGTIVDIGSGQGISSQHLGEFQGMYIGIEPSRPLVARARELYGENKSLKFAIGNAYELPLKDKCADGVISVNVWFHLASLDIAAQELSRVLKKGGVFNIITSNPEAYIAWRNYFENYREEGKLISGKLKVPVNALTRNDIYLHTTDEIIDSFDKVGLKIIQIVTLGVTSKSPDKPFFLSIQGIKNF